MLNYQRVICHVCLLKSMHLVATAVATAIWLGYATQLSGLTERYRIRLIKSQNPKGNWAMQQQSPQNSRVSWSSFTIGASWGKLLDAVLFEVWSKKHPYPVGCPLNQLITYHSFQFQASFKNSMALSLASSYPCGAMRLKSRQGPVS